MAKKLLLPRVNFCFELVHSTIYNWKMGCTIEQNCLFGFFISHLLWFIWIFSKLSNVLLSNVTLVNIYLFLYFTLFSNHSYLSRIFSVLLYRVGERGKKEVGKVVKAHTLEEYIKVSVHQQHPFLSLFSIRREHSCKKCTSISGKSKL